MDEVYQGRSGLAAADSLPFFNLVRARAAGNLALIALRLPIPGWLESMVTIKADQLVSELGL